MTISEAAARERAFEIVEKHRSAIIGLMAQQGALADIAAALLRVRDETVEQCAKTADDAAAQFSKFGETPEFALAAKGFVKAIHRIAARIRSLAAKGGVT